MQLAAGCYLTGHRQYGLEFLGNLRKPSVEGGVRIERGRAIPFDVGAGHGTKGTVNGPPRAIRSKIVRGPKPLALGIGDDALGSTRALHGHGEPGPSWSHLKPIFAGGPSGIDAALGPGSVQVQTVVECDFAIPGRLRPNPFDGALAQGGDGDCPSFEFLTVSCPCPT